jgi:uncharacterized protein (TIGR02001 family)
MPVDATPIALSALTVDAYASVASQYVYRGIAQRDRPTPILAITTNTAQGWFVDVWSGLADAAYQYDYPPEHGSEWDIDASLGYGASFAGDWAWSLAGARLVDVGGGNGSDDYTEWRANLFFRDEARAQFAYADDYLQTGWSSWNAELAGSASLTDTLSGEWGMGHSHGAATPDADYSYGWMGLSGAWSRTRWDVRWIDTTDDTRDSHESGRDGSRVVVTLSWVVHLLP